MRFSALLLAMPFIAGVTPSAVSDTSIRAGAPVEITEWPVPWAGSRPRDPFVDARGRVWFVGQQGNYLAYLEPGAGTFRRFELRAGTHPHNLIVDDRGIVWYAGNRNAHIGAFDPDTERITEYPMPDSAARDPHTLVADGNGHIWFTVQGGGYVGRLTMASGEVRLVKIPTARARPYGIVLDARGRPWFNEFGTNLIGTIDPRTFALREYPLPDARAYARRLAITSDGAIWYGDYGRGLVSRLDTASGSVEEIAAPSGPRSLPYAMTVDDRDRIWFVETGVQPNRLVGFDTRARTFVSETPIPSGGGVVRHMVFHRPSRELWFGTDAGTIGRARIP